MEMPAWEKGILRQNANTQNVLDSQDAYHKGKQHAHAVEKQ
jgi:hypothetical protein